MKALDRPTRNLFFTGKGGVGKTSASCAVAVVFTDKAEDFTLKSSQHSHNKVTSYMSNSDLIEVITEDNNENIVERDEKKHRTNNSQHSAKLFEEKFKEWRI